MNTISLAFSWHSIHLCTQIQYFSYLKHFKAGRLWPIVAPSGILKWEVFASGRLPTRWKNITIFAKIPIGLSPPRSCRPALRDIAAPMGTFRCLRLCANTNITPTIQLFITTNWLQKNRCAEFNFWHTFKAYNFIWYTVIYTQGRKCICEFIFNLWDTLPSLASRRLRGFHNK